MSGQQLDEWADALDVTNDDDAERWLAVRVGRALDLLEEVEHLAASLKDIPDDDARNAVVMAGAHLRDLVDDLDYARRSFARHERGNR